MEMNEATARLVMDLDGFLKHFPVKIQDVGPGHCDLSIELVDIVMRPGGIMNGGAIMSLCDLAGGISAMSLQDVRNAFTVDLNTQFIEMINNGPVKFHGEVIRAGKSTAFIDIDVRDSMGKLCSRSTGIWKIIRE